MRFLLFPELHFIIHIMHTDMLLQDNMIIFFLGGGLGENMQTACRRGQKWTFHFQIKADFWRWFKNTDNVNSQACLRILIPQMWVVVRLRFAVSPLRWMYLMSDPSLPALPVSDVSPSTPVVYPQTDLCEVDATACSCALASKADKPFGGCTRICFSTSSSPPLPPILSLYVPLFKSSQASPSLCLLSSFFQVEAGGSKQPGSFPSSFFPLHFLVFPCVAALSVFSCCGASTFLQIELRESLDQPFWRSEIGFGVFLFVLLPTNT